MKRLHWPSGLSARTRKAGARAWPFIWRALALLLLVNALYLLVANVVLLTPLLRAAVNAHSGVALDYDWAYSPWPGRVVVKNLTLRVEDYNIQFSVGIERSTVDVALRQLVRRRFHADHVKALGTTFRMRHKLHEIGKDGPRVAAFPPIAGFADPPLYRGPEPPPIPDSAYALWEVSLDDVSADVRELWILEYRYRGRGNAKGRFLVRPARWFEVGESTLTLEGGKLTLGDVPVAEHAHATLHCRVEGTDPRTISGLDPLRRMTASWQGLFEGSELAFLNAYLEPRAGLRALGSGRSTLDLSLKGGLLAEGSRMVIESPDSSLGTPRLSVRGPSTWSLTVPKSEGGGVIHLAFQSRRLSVEGSRTRGPAPFLEHLAASLEVTRDLSRALETKGLALDSARLTVPALAWFEPLLPEGSPKLGGSGTLDMDGRRAGAGRFEGHADTRFARLSVQAPSYHFEADGRVEARFDCETEPPRKLTFDRLRLHIEGVDAGVGTLRTRQFAANLASADLVLTSLEPIAAHGSVNLDTDRAAALLPLLLESKLVREIAELALRSSPLTARVSFRAEAPAQRFELTEAHAGRLSVRGFLQVPAESHFDGAFLLSTPSANVGVRLHHGAVSLVPFASDNWLPRGSFVLPHGPP